LELWKPRLPVTERVLEYPGRAPKMFRSGRCGNPACRAWVTTWVTMTKAISRMRHRAERGLMWRPVGAPPTRFCSDACRDVVTGCARPVAAPEPEPKAKKPKVVHPQTPMRIGTTVWAGAYCRRPACRAGFITRIPVVGGFMGARPPFCSDACQRDAGKVLRGPAEAARRRQHSIETAGKLPAIRVVLPAPVLPTRILAAGWCQRRGCGRDMMHVVPLYPGSREPLKIPRFCSSRCWLQQHRERIEVARALSRARRWCRTCWQAVKADGYEICGECFEVLQESCRRKRRRSEQVAVDAAVRRSKAEGRDITAYPCRVCSSWHIGGTTAAWKSKRVAFIASVFVATTAPGEVRRLVQVWNPKNMNLNQDLSGHAGLEALRAQLAAAGR
jgi:hypothetical protein